MEALGLNPLSTAQKAGLGKDAVRDIVRGKSQRPSNETLQRIAKVLACTVADLTGERASTPIKTRDRVTIFEVNTYAQSGGPGGDGDSGVASDRAVAEYSFPTAGFRQRFGASPDGVFIDEVRGDSQEPTLMAGQLIMVDTRDRKPSPPGLFLCWDGMGMVLKRIEFIPNSEPPTLRLLSDNDRYSAYERTVSEVEIYGRVVGTWRRF